MNLWHAPLVSPVVSQDLDRSLMCVNRLSVATVVLLVFALPTYADKVARLVCCTLNDNNTLFDKLKLRKPTSTTTVDRIQLPSSTGNDLKISEVLPSGTLLMNAGHADGCINVLDRGAVADLIVDANGNYVSGTDNTTAFQSAITLASSLRKVVCVPGGSYYLASGLLLDISEKTSDSDSRPSIRGDGQSATWLRFGDGAFDAITIKGSATRAGPHAYLTLYGLRIQKADVKGHGIDVNIGAFLKVEDVTITGFDIGLNGIDMLSSTVRNSNIGSNRIGVNLARKSFSYPNAISFIDTHISNNFETGLAAANPTTLSIQGGEIGANGWYSKAPTRGGVYINGGPAEGGVSFASDHVYYEINAGQADIIINANDHPGVYNIQNSSFNRISGVNYVTNNITAAGSAPILLNVQGNAFKRFGDYQASASRPYISMGGATNPASTLEFSTINLMDDPAIEGVALLEWKLWAPNFTAVSGKLGNVTVNEARYRRVGKTVMLRLDVTTLSNGNGAAALAFDLPVAALASSRPTFSGQNLATGEAVFGHYVGSSAQVCILKYNGLYPGGNGTRIAISGFYETN